MRVGVISGTEKKTGGKALVCITEDWFALSHFIPLLRALCDTMAEVVVVTRIDKGGKRLEEIGVRPIHFDYRRGSLNPVTEVSALFRLRKILRKERPQILHLIAIKPLFLGTLASGFLGIPHIVKQLTGAASLSEAQGPKARLVAGLVSKTISAGLSRPNTWLIVENPDDRAWLTAQGARVGVRSTILGGAGVDPAHFTDLPLPQNRVPRIGFAGRMLTSKGIEDLIAAQEILQARGLEMNLQLCGQPDAGNPAAIPITTLNAWARRAQVDWSGHLEDIRVLWRNCDIAVMPSRVGEGMPRSMLEAAACGRPLIVTDVSGCRHFVRNATEGYVVPPMDPQALAESLEKLIHDPELRQRMGRAARARVLSGYTEEHVQGEIVQLYKTLMI